jgi:transposase
MEGYNGARLLDRIVQEKGYRLFNVNNLKLARFKEVFSGEAKTDPIDTRKILKLFRLKDQLPMAPPTFDHPREQALALILSSDLARGIDREYTLHL